MIKRLFTLSLSALLIGLFMVACTNDDGAPDSMVNGDGEIVNEENSTDDDSDDTTDTTDDENNGDSTNDDSDNSDNGDGDGNDSNNNGADGEDDANNDDTSNDDAPDDDSPEATLVGDWRLVSALVNDGRASTVFNGSTIGFPFTSTSQDEDVDIRFQENPNSIQGMGQYTNVIQFTFLSQNFTEETVFESPITDGNWELNNEELIISDSSQASGTFTIVELSETTLILQTDFEETVPVDDFELDATGVLVIELERN